MPRNSTYFDDVMASLRRQRFSLIFLSAFVNILMLVTAIYMLQIYDRVLTSGSLNTLFWLTAIALFALAIYGILEQTRRIILIRSAGYLDSALNAPVLQRVMQRRLEGAPPAGGVRDVSDLRNYYQSDAALAFLDAPWTPVFLLIIWALHPALGAVATVGAVVLFTAALANDQMTRTRQKDAAVELRAANDAAIRYSSAGETIAPLGMVKAIFKRWRSHQDQARDQQQALTETTTTILSFTRAFRLGLQVLILGTGAYFVLAGQLTSGGMIGASIIMGRALAPIERSTAAWSRFVAARNARQRLSDMFETEDKAEPVRLPKPKGELAVEKLSFVAPDTGTAILKGIDFALPSGNICAVVGPSGAGKSTLCRLLVGAWEPTVGHVRLDGADVHEWDSEDFGQYIGYLPQNVELFPGTIGENIARFRDCDSTDIVHAAQLAGVHDMILRMPGGYECQVGKAGNRISQGQRQRIGLARALFGDPSFVVLDEPNSNLDRAGDKALHDAMTTLRNRGASLIVVSHRTGILRLTDKIMFLDKGQMQRFGDRSEFLQPTAAGTVREKSPATIKQKTAAE